MKTVRPCYFQNRIIMFCLPISTFMYLWVIFTFPGLVCLFCCSQIDRPILGIYTVYITHRYMNVGVGNKAVLFHFWGNINRDFRYYVGRDIYPITSHLTPPPPANMGSNNNLFLFIVSFSLASSWMICTISVVLWGGNSRTAGSRCVFLQINWIHQILF